MATFEDITRHDDADPDDDDIWVGADAKGASADAANAVGKAVMDYNLRMQPIIREILDRMFRANGML